jgi:Carboxypeptidase regulatory-like domain
LKFDRIPRSTGFLLLAFLSLVASAHAQVQLRGKAVSDTDVPLGNATVWVRPQPLPGSQVRALTNAAGTFSFDLPHPGDYVVDVECSGFFKLSSRDRICP